MNDVGVPVLRACGLCKQYGKGEGLVRAVDEVDLDVASGQTVAVMGPSGCGKSTLLHLLGGLDRPSGGELWLAHVSALARALGASPGQVTAGIAAAQVLPAVPGMLLGIPLGIGLFDVAAQGAGVVVPPASWLAGAVLGTLAVLAVLAALPARMAPPAGVPGPAGHSS